MLDELPPLGQYSLNGIIYIVTQANIQRLDQWGNTEYINGLGLTKINLIPVYEIEVKALVRTYGKRAE